jgi:uncharacterized protein YjbJ (UPF0337 family)
MSLPTTEQIQAKWQQHVGAAKMIWGKLTEDELLKSEGRVQKLTGLVQERYAIPSAQAEIQVKNFLSKHDS